jgi:hypothetical protein
LAPSELVFELDVLALDVTQFAQPLAEGLNEKGIAWSGRQNTDPPHLCGLLSTRDAYYGEAAAGHSSDKSPTIHLVIASQTSDQWDARNTNSHHPSARAHRPAEPTLPLASDGERIGIHGFDAN